MNIWNFDYGYLFSCVFSYLFLLDRFLFMKMMLRSIMRRFSLSVFLVLGEYQDIEKVYIQQLFVKDILVSFSRLVFLDFLDKGDFCLVYVLSFM